MLSAIQHVAECNTGIYFPQEPSDQFLADRLEFEMQFGHHNRTAGCGVPLVYRYKDLGQCLDSENGYVELASLSMDLMRALRDTPHEEVRRMTKDQLIASGLASFVQIMIKEEPHSKSKFEEERFRVISRCPAQGVLVERVLYGDLVDVNLAKWDTQPSKPGMGLDDVSNRKIWDAVESKRQEKPGESNDVAGWDAKCPEEIHDANTEVLVKITHASPRWENMIRNYEYLQQRAFFVLSNGKIYVLTQAVKQLSGRFLTAFNNSNMRNLVNYVSTPIALHKDVWGIFMGDDSVVDGSPKDYERLGLVITDRLEAPRGQPFDFCSHRYVGDVVAHPSNWGRTLYKLMSKPYSDVFFGQFLEEMRWLQPYGDAKATIADVVALLSWSGWLPHAQVDGSNKIS
jgi:hypothetical protein